MTQILDLIADGIAEWAEAERVPLTGPEVLIDLGVDSLGVLMVAYHVAKSLDIDLSGLEADEHEVTMLSKCATVQDLADYVSAHLRS